jgi:type I restriction enzyme S subunit
MRKTRLSDICQIISGGTPKTDTKEYWNGDVGWLSVVDFNNDDRFVYSTEKTITELGVANSSTKYLEVGDIIVSARGTVGALAQIGKRMCFNQSCFVLRGKEGILDNGYLFYWLRTYVTGLRKKSQGSVFETINLKIFDDIEIDPPTIETQCRIVKILSILDDKIELNNKINSELGAVARSLYGYWFVQFDFPDGSGRPYKTNGGAMVWSDELKCEIPKGWEVKNMGEVGASIVTGKTPSTKDTANFDGEIPFVTIDDIRSSLFIVNTARTLSDAGASSLRGKCIPENSLLVSCIGTVGVMGFTSSPSYTNQQINAIIPSYQADAYYFYFALKDYFQFSSGAKTGNTIPNMSKGDFEQIKLLMPSSPLLNQFASIVESVFDKIQNSTKENSKLRNIRDWLLPMLMNGQVSVN